MARLRKEGHHVETLPTGTPDELIWPHAQEHDLIVLTGNPDDFTVQAARTADHNGLLLVHGERDARKQMSDAAIAAAIEYVREVHGETVRGQQINLNEWRRSP